MGAIWPQDLALPHRVVRVLQRRLLWQRRLLSVQQRLIQDRQFRIQDLRSQSIDDQAVRNAQQSIVVAGDPDQDVSSYRESFQIYFLRRFQSKNRICLALGVIRFNEINK